MEIKQKIFMMAKHGKYWSFVINFIVFTLAIFVGYFVVWAVTPALHTSNECY